MNHTILISAVAVCFSATLSTAQQFLTAGQLLDLCASKGRSDCYQYIMGAHDAIVASQNTILANNRIVASTPSHADKLRNLLIETGELSCIPAGTDAEVLRQSFVQWMIRNDSSDFDAGRILGAAFAQSFPCSN